MALIDHGGLAPAEACLIHGGSGGVGHVAVQLASRMGATVVSTAGSDNARHQLQQFGADVALDYDRDDLASAIGDTVATGVDVTVDHRVGEYLELDIDVAASGGRIIVLNGDLSSIPNTSKVLGDALTIQGMSTVDMATTRPILRRFARLLKAGDISVAVADTYDLAEAADAQRAIDEEHFVGKLIITP